MKIVAIITYVEVVLRENVWDQMLLLERNKNCNLMRQTSISRSTENQKDKINSKKIEGEK